MSKIFSLDSSDFSYKEEDTNSIIIRLLYIKKSYPIHRVTLSKFSSSGSDLTYDTLYRQFFTYKLMELQRCSRTAFFIIQS